MLRTPTHIVELELGINGKTTTTTTTVPASLMHKIHSGIAVYPAGQENHQLQRSLQYNSNKLYYDDDERCQQPLREYQLQNQRKDTTPDKLQQIRQQQQQQPTSFMKENLAKSFLLAHDFLFKKLKKTKSTTTTKATTNNSNHCDTTVTTATPAPTITTTVIPTTPPKSPHILNKTACITLANSHNNNNTYNNNNNNNIICPTSYNNNNYLLTTTTTLSQSDSALVQKSPTKTASSSAENALSKPATTTSRLKPLNLSPSTASDASAISCATTSSYHSIASSTTSTCTNETAALLAASATLSPATGSKSKLKPKSGALSGAGGAAATTSPLVMSPTSQTPTRTSLFDSCHRKIRLIGGGPVAFLGGLVAKARRKERDGDQNSTDTKLYLEESVLERKLPEADLKALVDLPAGLDYNEWLASHTLALFEHVNLVYGTISEFCTPAGCQDMTGPGNRTYLWFDEKGKKTRVAAPQYIDYVMTFTQKTVSDESIFPTKYANEFPSSFESIARKILRLQFHVIAHLYAAHFREIALLGLHTHLNLTFAHLTALHRRFNLIDEKETDVLRDLEVALRLTDDSQPDGAADGIANNTNAVNTATGAGAGSATNYNQHHQIAAAQQYVTTSTHLVGGGGAGATTDAENPLQASATTLIDGDAAVPPICTQPEASSKPTTNTPANSAAAVFGGGGGLIGGILGDLTSGEFGDTTRYCTSAVPSCSNSATTDAAAAAAAAAGAAANSNNGGAGALHLNFYNNNHNNHNLHHHHHHHHPHLHQHHAHQHHLLQQHQHTPNTGLIQCNASTAPNATTTTSTTTTA